jgi:hypothetical protein
MYIIGYTTFVEKVVSSSTYGMQINVLKLVLQ